MRRDEPGDDSLAEIPDSLGCTSTSRMTGLPWCQTRRV